MESNRLTKPWSLVAIVVLAAAGVFIYQSRLAFVPDERVAAAVRETCHGSISAAEATAKLASRYKVLGVGNGDSWRPSLEAFTKPASGLTGVHVLVGEYRGLPYKTAIEAQVLLRPDGSVSDVQVRRTRDAL